MASSIIRLSCRNSLLEPSFLTLKRTSRHPDTTKISFKKKRAVNKVVLASISPTETIMAFYSAINQKNMKLLAKLVSEECVFEDCTFYAPFKGKRDVLNFMEQLVSCMGQNMQFHIDSICNGDDNSTAAVNWHLNWNTIKVPFTRGCSNYWLEVVNEKLVIGKAQVLIESPIKPGLTSLTLFRVVATLFDAFPAATEWLLTSPHVVLQLFYKAYLMCIKPIVRPFVAWYTKLLSYAALIFSISIRIISFLTKNF